MVRASAKSVEQELLVTELISQIAAMQKRFQAEGEDEERLWMMANAPNDEVISFLKEATVMMLHMVDAIGESEPINGITISKRFGVPRGSVSKMTRRLAELGVIQAESLPDNRKEVLFRLTSLGRQIFEIHQRLHVHMNRNVREFLSRYDLDQLRFLVQCMKDTVETSWVRLEKGEEEEEEDVASPASTGSGVPSEPSRTDEASEIMALLRQLDARKLKKAKELLRIAFTDD
ncbi:winged helix DNA-binding protein [Cohnella thailandensis]|uniref:winged helix DNA-binding protein n=1 Tax=Cohnella thailandensis TaxID=557557 RepID=UPI001D842D75|nr:DNA-binding MarR family transcriptional regulator [Cohnella thailandensis]